MSVNFNAGGINAEDMFKNLVSNIETRGAELKKAMDQVGEGKLDETQLLKMQFMVNQYNTMLEMTSTVTKALVDEAKQIAQRAN